MANNIVQQKLECCQAHQSPSLLVHGSSSIHLWDGLGVAREGNMMGNRESENDFEVRKFMFNTVTIKIL